MLYVFDKRVIAVFGQIQEGILHKYFEHHQELFDFAGFELIDFFADAELSGGYAAEVRFNRIEDLVGPINFDVQNILLDIQLLHVLELLQSATVIDFRQKKLGLTGLFAKSQNFLDHFD
jgi:hypothetical protein